MAGQRFNTFSINPAQRIEIQTAFPAEYKVARYLNGWFLVLSDMADQLGNVVNDSAVMQQQDNFQVAIIL